MGCGGCQAALDRAMEERELKRKYPKLRRMALNFTESMAKSAYAAVRGKPVFSEEEMIRARLHRCMHCEYFDRKPGRCFECGCFVAVKARLKEEECPLYRW